MDAPVENEARVAEATVRLRGVTQARGGRGYKIGCKGQVDTLGHVRTPVCLAMTHHRGHVDLEDRGHMGTGLFALHHVARNRPPDGRQGSEGFVG